GTADVNGDDVAKGWKVWLGKARRIAVERENAEPLVAIVTRPYGIAALAHKCAERRQACWFGALADDRHVGPQAHQRMALAVQRHAAIPDDEPHAGVHRDREPRPTTGPSKSSIIMAHAVQW